MVHLSHGYNEIEVTWEREGHIKSSGWLRWYTVVHTGETEHEKKTKKGSQANTYIYIYLKLPDLE